MLTIPVAGEKHRPLALSDNLSDSLKGITSEGLGIIFFNFVSNYHTSHCVYALCRDIKKARLLLKSVITTNPQHGPGKYQHLFSKLFKQV